MRKSSHIYRIILFTAFLSFGAFSSHAQVTSDSLMIQQLKAAYKLASEKPDSVFKLAVSALHQYRQSGNDRMAAFAYKTRGWANMHMGSYDSAFADFQTAVDLFHRVNDSLELLSMYATLSRAYSNRNLMASSAAYLLQADSLSQQLHDLPSIARVKIQMGVLYRTQKEFQKAIPYFREGIQRFKDLNDTVKYVNACNSFSALYMEMGMPDSSLALLDIALPLANKLAGYKYEKAMLQEKFGDTYFALARYDRSLGSYNNAYQLFGDIKDRASLAYEGMNLGKVNIQLKKYPVAETYLLESYRLNDSLRMTGYAASAAQRLSELYSATGNWQRAYQWLVTNKRLRDTLQSVQKDQDVLALQAKYEANKKDNEINLLRKDRQLRDTELQKERTVKAGAFLLAGLLVIIGFLVVNRNRIIQKAKRMVEIEKLRNDIARDLHDDIGSALSSININSNMALNRAEEQGVVRSQLEKIKANSGRIMESMGDIVWAINPGNDSMDNLLSKMKEFLTEILEPININYSLKESEDLRSVKLGVDRRKEIYLIFKEAVNNAAKYSQGKNINVSLTGHAKELLLEVTDDGKGFDPSTPRQGNGLRNMQKRAKGMNGHLQIDSAAGGGTAIRLSLAIT